MYKTILILISVITLSACNKEELKVDNTKPIIKVVKNYHELLGNKKFDEASELATKQYSSHVKILKNVPVFVYSYKKKIKNIFVERVHNDVAIVDCIFDCSFEYGNRLIIRKVDGEWKIAGLFGAK